MPLDFEIRAITPADAQEVSTLSIQLGYSRPASEVRVWIEALHRDGRPQMAFVASAADKIIGWIEISIEHRIQSPPFALIGGLVVDHDHRGQGIGRALCNRAESWAWEQGVEALRVTSRSTRLDAHRFYLRDGYREMKTSLVFEKPRPR